MADSNSLSPGFFNHTLKEELEEAYDDFEDDIVIKYEPKYAEVMQESFFENDYLTSNTNETESLETLNTNKGSENSGNMIIPFRIKSEKEEDGVLEDKITPLNHCVVNSTKRLQENVTEFLASGIHATRLDVGDNSESNVDASNKKDRNFFSASNEIDSNTKTIDLRNESMLMKRRLNFSCPKCSYVTRCKSFLGRHIKSHIDFKNSSCDGCDFRSTPMALRHHQYKCETSLLKNPLPHSPKKKNKKLLLLSCPECSFVSYKTKLEPHIKSHINSNNVSCDGCNFKSTPSALRHHRYKCEFSLLKNNGNQSRFSCPECSYVTTRTSDLQPHIKSHINFKNSSCGGCNFKSTPMALRHHQYKCESSLLKNPLPQRPKSNKNLSRFSCPQCSFVTKSRSNLEPHLKSHINFKNSSCDGCNFKSTPIALRHHQFKCESYFSKNPLSQRQENKKNRKLSRFSCPKCSYVTTCTSNLEPHIKSHINFENSSCNGCNFKSTPLALRYHQYKCESYLLKNPLPHRPLPHRQKNKDNRNLSRFSCPKCSYATEYLSNLEPHLKSHIKFKNSSCDGCDFKSTPMALRHHQFKCESFLLKNPLSQREENKKSRMRTRSRCPECSFVTTSVSNFKLHVKSHKYFENSSCDACDFKSTPQALRYHQYKCEAYLLKSSLSQRPENQENK